MTDAGVDEARRLLDEEEEQEVINRLVDQGYAQSTAKRMVDDAQEEGSELGHVARILLGVAAFVIIVLLVMTALGVAGVLPFV